MTPTFGDGFWLDTAVLQSLTGTLSERYRTASPLPHVTIDGVISEGSSGKLLDEFPPPTAPT